MKFTPEFEIVYYTYVFLLQVLQVLGDPRNGSVAVKDAEGVAVYSSRVVELGWISTKVNNSANPGPGRRRGQGLILILRYSSVDRFYFINSMYYV